MADYMIVNGELYHHGVKGMKWGVRKKQNAYTARNVRGHAGPGKYFGSDKRKLDKAKGDLERLNRGEHLSVGTTKKRQAAYDARDRAALEKSISKLEGNIKRKAEKKAAEKSTSSARKRDVTIAATAVVGTALAAYGAHKLTNAIRDKNFKHSMRNGTKTLSYWAEKGKLDIGLDQVKSTFDANYGASIPSIIKNNIANNSVNGKVDWKAIRNIYR